MSIIHGDYRGVTREVTGRTSPVRLHEPFFDPGAVESATGIGHLWPIPVADFPGRCTLRRLGLIATLGLAWCRGDAAEADE